MRVKKAFGLSFAALLLAPLLIAHPAPSRADALCYNAGYPTPAPIATGQATLGICTAGALHVTGSFPTPAPQPTQPYQVVITAPTAASGAVKTTACDPTTSGHCQEVETGGSAHACLAQGGASSTCLSFFSPSSSLGDADIGLLVMAALYGQDPGAGGLARLLAPNGVLVTAPAHNNTILTSSSTTACTNISTAPGTLATLINTGPAMVVFPEFYDDATGTCPAGNLVYGDGSTIVLGAGQILTLNIPLAQGWSYKLSGSLTSNLLVVYN